MRTEQAGAGVRAALSIAELFFLRRGQHACSLGAHTLFQCSAPATDPAPPAGTASPVAATAAAGGTSTTAALAAMGRREGEGVSVSEE